MTRNQLKGKTLREIVQIICPSTIGDNWAGGVKGCPSSYRFFRGEFEFDACQSDSNPCSSCTECWNQKWYGNSQKEIDSNDLDRLDEEDIKLETVALNTDKPSYQRIVKVIPVAHHYEEPGTTPEYVKYSCPICDMANDKHQVTPICTQCPVCNVNLDWSRYE